MSERDPQIYVLYTGGTIGMAGHPLAPMSADAFEALVATMPGFTPPWLTLQTLDNQDFRVRYTFDAFDDPIDSSAMTPLHWVRIARRVLAHHGEYDGFVVVHGTDTMGWTSSALAFLLEGLAKPVVVTGSQIPLAQTRTDGLRNLVTAMHVAATTTIPEVGLLFDQALYRGCRAAKVSTNAFDGFASPNGHPLARAGITIEVDQGRVRPAPPSSVTLDDPANRARLARRLVEIEAALPTFSVLSLALFPGIQQSNAVEVVLGATEPPVRGVVLQAFGEGNAPSTPSFLDALRQAHERGVVIVDGTQVMQGSVNVDAYQSASGLESAGAISGYDMTPEAAQAKLVYLLALGLAPSEIRRLMQQDLRGELEAQPGPTQGLTFASG
ncbi:MAG: asparaginase domain-containing protein [Deltaproteobacteria bacterium]|nr:asparaginase domain-containing protein [Deltaproteobacteria bacterium]